MSRFRIALVQFGYHDTGRLQILKSEFQFFVANTLLQGRLSLNICLMSRERVGCRALAGRESGMPRVASAVFMCMFAAVPLAAASTVVLAETARTEKTENPTDNRAPARATGSTKEPGGELRLASHDPVGGASKRAGGNADSEPDRERVEKPKKAPARQIPVEPVETSADQYDFEASENQDDESGGHGDGKLGGEVTEDAGQTPVEKAPDSGPEKEAATAGAHGREPAMLPGLPVRKPPKPKVRRDLASGKSSKKSPSSRTERDKQLCRVLQSCRNDFVKCKSKIKFSDQSEPWIIAKEKCGAVYKTCVAKNFRSGEWTFTRWFYFGDLQCK